MGALVDLIQGTHVGRALKERQDKQEEERYKAFEDKHQKVQDIAKNIQAVVPPDYNGPRDLESLTKLNNPNLTPLLQQYSAAVQEANSIYKPGEAPLLMRAIQRVSGKQSQPKPAKYQVNAQEEMAATPQGTDPLAIYRAKLAELNTIEDPERRADLLEALQNTEFGAPKEKVPAKVPIAPSDIGPTGKVYERDTASGEITSEDVPGYNAAEEGKPFEPKFNPATGGLYGLTNGKEFYDASNIATAPEQVQAQWKSLLAQQDAESKQKAADQATKEAASEKRTADEQQRAHGLRMQEKATQQKKVLSQQQAYARAKSAETSYNSGLAKLAALQNDIDAIGLSAYNPLGTGGTKKKGLQGQYDTFKKKMDADVKAWKGAYKSAIDNGVDPSTLTNPNDVVAPEDSPNSGSLDDDALKAIGQ